jgi:hypothetical protein
VPPTPAEPSRNPIVRSLVWLYDRTWFHWLISFLAQPVYSIMGAFYRLLAVFWPIPLWQDWQNRPEPKFPLPLTRDDIPVKTRLCDGCGSYVGTLIGTYVDAKQLATVLPAGTSLDPAHIHDGQHALILLFGYTENLHFGWWPFRGLKYLECGVAVPHIMIDDQVDYVTRFFNIPLLHLNRLYPVVLGWSVGYRKKWSRVTTTFDTYSIKGLFTGRPILDAKFTLCPAVSEEKTDHWKELLEEPHLNYFFGDKLCMHFHWDWSSAQMQPVDATVTLHEDFPGISAGTYHFEGMDTGKWSDGRAPIGAVRLTAPFELLLPFSLKKLRGHLVQQQVPD